MRHNRLISYLLLGAFSVLAIPACSDDEKKTTDDTEKDDSTDDEDSGAGGTPEPDDTPVTPPKPPKPKPEMDGGAVEVDGGAVPEPDAATPPAPPVECPALAKRKIVEVAADIKADTTWSCKNLYVLTNITYVTGGTLTIEAGTEVQGDELGALVVTSKAKLMTEGTAEAPVVFTSSVSPGGRDKGQWAGLVMLGKAPINVTGGTNQIEGLDATEERGIYGGADATHNCGHLMYTRIEWAGKIIGLDNELNALTLGGCGSDTMLEYVQVHKGLDDGLEIFGGSPTVSHLVASSISDDSLDWDEGFSGTVQFFVAVQDSADGDAGWETDNSEADNDAMPRSNPVVYNATLVGGAKTGWVARRGTWGTIGNSIFTNFTTAAIDVRDPATVVGTTGGKPSLVVRNSMFFQNGTGGTVHFSDAADNDGGFDEDAYFREAAWKNEFDVDPQLPDTSRIAPMLVPPKGSPAAMGGTPPAGFDAKAKYIGAFEPGGKDWMEGWTDFSEK